MPELEPLLWNTLDEAATWLARETDEEWSVRRVLNRALQIQASQAPQLSAVTLLCAAPPREFVIAQRRESPANTLGERKTIEVRVPWQPLPLFADHVKQLLVSGHANVGESVGLVPDRPGMAHRGRIDPALKVTLAMVGIVGRNLTLFAGTGSTPAVAASIPSADDERAAAFEPVSLATLEKMFPSARWKPWAEHGKDNGLDVARVKRGKYNPYRASIWFLARGMPDWDQARINRVLKNNLPARSRDRADLFEL